MIIVLLGASGLRKFTIEHKLAIYHDYEKIFCER